MSLYDTMANGEHVKCFYSIAFWNGDYFAFENNGFGNTTHIGGELRGFNIGEKLPITTRFYKYPKDFCIFDFRSFDSAVHVIRDGIYDKFISPDKIQRTDILPYWIDNYGRQINITSENDFKKIERDFKKHTEKILEVLREYDLIGLLNKAAEVEENSSEYEDIMAKYNLFSEKKQEKLLSITIMDKWYADEIASFAKEKQFGEFIVAYERQKSERADSSPTQYDYEKAYLDCVSAFKNFLEKNNGIVDRYLSWQELPKDEVAEIKTLVEFIRNFRD